MNFSVNQNRQLYYVDSIAESLTAGIANAGKVKVVANTFDNTFYVQQINATGEPVRSDIIKGANILNAQAGAPTDMENKLKSAIVVLDSAINSGNPIVGQDYVLRINLRQYFGMGDDTTYVKDVAVHATSATNTPTTFYAAMAEAIKKSFSRELEMPFTVTSSASCLTLTEKEGAWALGTMKEEPLLFELYTTTVYDSTIKDDVIWGKVAYSGNTKYTDGTTISGVTVPALASRSTLNSHKIADLEYFCAGERGDQYRNVGWPMVIPTKYFVNGNSTTGYYTLDVHYAYIGDGMENQASEKTMTFVSATLAPITTIITALKSVNSGLKVSCSDAFETANATADSTSNNLVD